MRGFVKRFILGLVSAMVISGSAFGAEVNFNSLVCRSYDYYQLGGDRKVLEVAVSREPQGTYRVTVARAYEILLANQEYRERDRSTEVDLQGFSCTQASAAIDPKVVTCATPSIVNYFSLARLDRTLTLSAFSSTPGRVVKTTTYEATLYSVKEGEYPGFDPKDCVLN